LRRRGPRHRAGTDGQRRAPAHDHLTSGPLGRPRYPTCTATAGSVVNCPAKLRAALTSGAREHGFGDGMVGCECPHAAGHRPFGGLAGVTVRRSVVAASYPTSSWEALCR
jgi:hypothetical protein